MQLCLQQVCFLFKVQSNKAQLFRTVAGRVLEAVVTQRVAGGKLLVEPQTLIVSFQIWGQQI